MGEAMSYMALARVIFPSPLVFMNARECGLLSAHGFLKSSINPPFRGRGPWPLPPHAGARTRVVWLGSTFLEGLSRVCVRRVAVGRGGSC